MPPTTPAGHAVGAALAVLPVTHREALLLARSGLSYRDVAEELGLPLEKVRVFVLHSLLALTQARLATGQPVH